MPLMSHALHAKLSQRHKHVPRACIIVYDLTRVWLLGTICKLVCKLCQHALCTMKWHDAQTPQSDIMCRRHDENTLIHVYSTHQVRLSCFALCLCDLHLLKSTAVTKCKSDFFSRVYIQQLCSCRLILLYQCSAFLLS